MKTTTLTISNPISDSLLRCALILIPFVLICVAILPGAHAVSPPPDGGYPKFNTAEGQSALFSLTTGSANTAVGWFSLSTNAAESFNTATGAGSLLFNTADKIRPFGAAALLLNTTGINNTAIGAAALSNNTTADGNTANGAFALFSNTEGVVNTASGGRALYSNTTGSEAARPTGRKHSRIAIITIIQPSVSSALRSNTPEAKTQPWVLCRD